MAEVVDAGVTGLLVDTLGQAVEAISEIARIDRSRCAARARERFGVDRMVDDYVRIYRELA
jgi:glycosyltransferase involved in cell wall biosynthesis